MVLVDTISAEVGWQGPNFIGLIGCVGLRLALDVTETLANMQRCCGLSIHPCCETSGVIFISHFPLFLPLKCCRIWVPWNTLWKPLLHVICLQRKEIHMSQKKLGVYILFNHKLWMLSWVNSWHIPTRHRLWPRNHLSLCTCIRASQKT